MRTSYAVVTPGTPNALPQIADPLPRPTPSSADPAATRPVPGAFPRDRTGGDGPGRDASPPRPPRAAAPSDVADQAAAHRRTCERRSTRRDTDAAALRLNAALDPAYSGHPGIRERSAHRASARTRSRKADHRVRQGDLSPLALQSTDSDSVGDRQRSAGEQHSGLLAVQCGNGRFTGLSRHYTMINACAGNAPEQSFVEASRSDLGWENRPFIRYAVRRRG